MLLRFPLLALTIGSLTISSLVQANYVWDKQNKLWKWVENPKPKVKVQKNNNNNNSQQSSDLENASLQVFNELSSNSKSRSKSSGQKKKHSQKSLFLIWILLSILQKS